MTMPRRRGRTIGTIIILAFVAIAAVYLATGRLGWAPFSHVKAETSPQAKLGATIVVNPTEAECRIGWQPGMRWTREQFTEFCEKLQSSK